MLLPSSTDLTHGLAGQPYISGVIRRSVRAPSATDGQVDLATVQTALPKTTAGGTTAAVGSGPLAERVLSYEREVILAELKRSQYKMSAAAKALGLERSHLYKKAEQLGIDLQAIRREHGTQD